MATDKAMVDDRKEIFGWAMYDWANSAFSTTIGTVFLGPYVAGLARTAAEAAGTLVRHLARRMGKLWNSNQSQNSPWREKPIQCSLSCGSGSQEEHAVHNQ